MGQFLKLVRTLGKHGIIINTVANSPTSIAKVDIGPLYCKSCHESALHVYNKDIFRCLSNSDYDYAYEDNIAMESIRPSSFERFSKLVPESFSGFLHRAGEMLGDSDYGTKIVSRSKEKTRSRPDPGMS